MSDCVVKDLSPQSDQKGGGSDKELSQCPNKYILDALTVLWLTYGVCDTNVLFLPGSCEQLSKMFMPSKGPSPTAM